MMIVDILVWLMVFSIPIGFLYWLYKAIHDRGYSKGYWAGRLAERRGDPELFSGQSELTDVTGMYNPSSHGGGVSG